MAFFGIGLLALLVCFIWGITASTIAAPTNTTLNPDVSQSNVTVLPDKLIYDFDPKKVLFGSLNSSIHSDAITIVNDFVRNILYNQEAVYNCVSYVTNQIEITPTLVKGFTNTFSKCATSFLNDSSQIVNSAKAIVQNFFKAIGNFKKGTQRCQIEQNTFFGELSCQFSQDGIIVSALSNIKKELTQTVQGAGEYLLELAPNLIRCSILGGSQAVVELNQVASLLNTCFNNSINNSP